MRCRLLPAGFMLALTLAGCAQHPDTAGGIAGDTSASAPPPAAEAPVMAEVPPAAHPPTVVPEVDRSCKIAADCEVKNVGNCCGYFPACVNKASATFPDLVAKKCAEQGVAGICGFPEIRACACVEGRCEASGAVTM